METNPVPIVTESNPTVTKKGGKGLLITTIACAVLAVAGVGFGVYGMIKANEKKPEPQPQEEVSDNTKCEVPEKTETTETEEVKPAETQPATIINTGDGPYIKDNYLYVPKWGVKYKLSTNLTNYGYAVDQTHQGDSYGNYVVGLTAILKKDYSENPQATYYNDIFSCSVVTVRAMENSKKDWWGDKKADISFNGFNFVIHDIWRETNCDSTFQTKDVASQLKAILSNPEKI